MWEQQDVKEEQPQTTTLRNLLMMIAAHDQLKLSASHENEEQAHGAAQ